MAQYDNTTRVRHRCWAYGRISRDEDEKLLSMMNQMAINKFYSQSPHLEPEAAGQLHVPAALSYVSGLEVAISIDDLITMRRHFNPKHYLQSFADCAERIRSLPQPEVEQLSLFYPVDDVEAADDTGLSFSNL